MVPDWSREAERLHPQRGEGTASSGPARAATRHGHRQMLQSIAERQSLQGGGDRLIKEQRLRKELDTTKTRTNLEASKRLKLLRLELEAATPGAARWRWRRLSGGARRCFHQAENVGGPSALY